MSPLNSTSYPHLSQQGIRLGPVVLHDISAQQLIDYLVANIGQGRVVSYVNAHALNLALKDAAFARTMKQVELFCDGFGVVLLARCQGQRIAHRITGPDFLGQLYDRIAAEGIKVYLLGDTADAVADYAANLREQLGDRLVGFHHGYILNDPAANNHVLDEIARLKPDLLLVGMGMPRQEQWVIANRGRLGNLTSLMVGAAFAWGSKKSGRYRGPRWATDRGLEWFFRLLHEPRLVWKRYLVGLPEVVVRYALWHLRPRR
jgi:N-acetylglucosaminyldiphosphoundecaprenol N-acetyl-beta-D-mannosaminyltransferase